MTPNEVCVALMAWERACPASHTRRRRVVYVEQDGPRHTWTLWQGGTQVGHCRAVCGVALKYERGLMLREWLGEPECGDARERLARLQARASWTVETSRGIAREAIGLYDAT